jgi:predicted transcriptional regulator
LVGQQEASRSEIRHLVSRFFRDSHEALLLNILRDDDISDTEVKRLREMLQVGSADNKDGQK